MFRNLANLPFFLNIVTHEASWAYLSMLYRYTELAAMGRPPKGSRVAPENESQAGDGASSVHWTTPENESQEGDDTTD